MSRVNCNIYRSLAVLVLLIFSGCAAMPSFIVKTEPAGAAIFVDGEQVGQAPATIKVKFTENAQMVPEKKILAVKLPGYKEKKVVLSPEGASGKLFDFTLEPETKEKTGVDLSTKLTATPDRENKSDAGLVSKESATIKQENGPVDAAVKQQPATAGQEGKN